MPERRDGRDHLGLVAYAGVHDPGSPRNTRVRTALDAAGWRTRLSPKSRTGGAAGAPDPGPLPRR